MVTKYMKTKPTDSFTLRLQTTRTEKMHLVAGSLFLICLLVDAPCILWCCMNALYYLYNEQNYAANHRHFKAKNIIISKIHEP